MRSAGSGERTDAVRLVVDTNLMIRALLSPGPARQFFRLAPLMHVLVYHSEQMLELREVAVRPRLDLAPDVVDELVGRIQHYGVAVESALDQTGDCRDPYDEYVLSLALAGAADVILTEDRDLLVLDPW